MLNRILLALGVLLAMAAPLLAQEQSLAEKGRFLAEQHCAPCHAVGAMGTSPHKEAPPFRLFAAKWPLRNLEEALAEGIVTGHPDMPAFEMEPDDIEALIEYLHTLSPGSPGRSAPGPK